MMIRKEMVRIYVIQCVQRVREDVEAESFLQWFEDVEAESFLQRFEDVEAEPFL